MVLSPPEQTAEKWVFLQKNAFSWRHMHFLEKNVLSCSKMPFPTEKCTFLQKNAVFGGHVAGNRRKSREALRTQESRALANFRKTIQRKFWERQLSTVCKLGALLGWPRSTVEKGPKSNESYERANPWNRTISTVLWVHRKLPQSTVKLVLPSNESYESKTGCNRTLATVLWVPLNCKRRGSEKSTFLAMFRGDFLRSACSPGIPSLEGPTRKPRHASVFSTHSETQAVPAFHCMRMFKGIISTRAFLKRTDTLSTIA